MGRNHSLVLFSSQKPATDSGKPKMSSEHLIQKESRNILQFPFGKNSLKEKRNVNMQEKIQITLYVALDILAKRKKHSQSYLFRDVFFPTNSIAAKTQFFIYSFLPSNMSFSFSLFLSISTDFTLLSEQDGHIQAVIVTVLLAIVKTPSSFGSHSYRLYDKASKVKLQLL